MRQDHECTIKHQFNQLELKWRPKLRPWLARPTTWFTSSMELSGHYTGWPKNGTIFWCALSSSNINRFSKFCHCQNQEKICNNTITNDPTTPQVCRYTTLWNVRILKATIENKTTSVTTHFKKLTTGNNVFIVSCLLYTSPSPRD